MAVRPYRKTGESLPSYSRALPDFDELGQNAAVVEELLRDLVCTPGDTQERWDSLAERYAKLKSLNSFAKQIVIRMFRSNPAFQGYKADFKDPVLKPHQLFLLGTLCRDFDHMNTSPLFGYNVLEVGCGALSSYGAAREDSSLVEQFYSDHPPFSPEILQILGAKVVGIDPRPNLKEQYDYTVSYKHRVVGFKDIKEWLKTVETPFDVITCFNLFDRTNFAYYYASPHEISGVLKALQRVLSPTGLLFCSPPFLPASPEKRQFNQQVFDGAGLRVQYEGYYFILRHRTKSWHDE